MDYKKKYIYFALVFICIKIFLAAFIELGNDEAYYYTYSLQPDLNHFDHPPLIGILIRLTTLNLTFVNDVTMRLGPIFGCAFSGYFVFLTVRSLVSPRAGWYAGVIYHLSVYSGFIAGFFILPDSPEMPFYTAALYIMAQLITSPKHDSSLFLWVMLGFVIGLATLSKIHGLFLWLGLGCYIMLLNRRLLFSYKPYLGFFVTLLCTTPIWVWNIQNHFITYSFHSGRISHPHFQLDGWLQEIIGEMLYQNPLVYFLLVWGILKSLRNNQKTITEDIRSWLMLMSFPMMAVFWCVAAFNPSLPHWSGPAFVPLCILAAISLEGNGHKKSFPTVLSIAMSIEAIACGAALWFANLAPFNTSKQTSILHFGENCPTLDISGWEQFSKDFDSLATNDVKKGIMPKTAPIFSNRWFPAGHLEYYVSRESLHKVLAIGKIEDIHKFAWLNKEGRKISLHQDAYCIMPSNLYFDVRAEFGGYFAKMDEPIAIPQWRGGKIVRYFWIYRLRDCIKVPANPL